MENILLETFTFSINVRTYRQDFVYPKTSFKYLSSTSHSILESHLGDNLKARKLNLIKTTGKSGMASRGPKIGQWYP